MNTQAKSSGVPTSGPAPLGDYLRRGPGRVVINERRHTYMVVASALAGVVAVAFVAALGLLVL